MSIDFSSLLYCFRRQFEASRGKGGKNRPLTMISLWRDNNIAPKRFFTKVNKSEVNWNLFRPRGQRPLWLKMFPFFFQSTHVGTLLKCYIMLLNTKAALILRAGFIRNSLTPMFGRQSGAVGNNYHSNPSPFCTHV